ncbi:tripartite tricarboxylate transporter substrate binding protein [Ramlibacter sp. RBP-2]|uniref:Tripartite tricarboxylate transporter substrate binding protein n=1 Tax=Ramlibacter lithotrophicus TaxID=2606681 RepID=A0A7X6I940_9BURK|nr:tripartite tricarboxylate transporter substrate binding protein [Ramlibacter lithotrophicus]NKE69068.1 tripartite tricarboxylate transporter substrate binding protein [Ramlibacter lithotrophicus]
MNNLQSLLAGTAVAISALCASAPAFAWPDRPIEIVVGFAAGGGTDITARTLAQHLGKALGGQVVVNNKPGASGAIGLSYVARAKADGYTLGMTNFPGVLTLPIERDAGFTTADFTYLGNLVRDPSAFSVTLSSPYKNLAEVIAAAKRAPGTISYGSTGAGTDDHLQMVMFEELTGTRLLHVPFQGAGPLKTAMLGGHVTIGGLNLGEVMPQAGKTMRPLAQASAKPSSLATDVPTFKEQGVDLVFASERGIVAPRGLPADVEQKIAAALRQIAASPEFQAQMKQQFTEMDYLPGAEWKKRLDASEAGFRRMWARKRWTD